MVRVHTPENDTCLMCPTVHFRDRAVLSYEAIKMEIMTFTSHNLKST